MNRQTLVRYTWWIRKVFLIITCKLANMKKNTAVPYVLNRKTALLNRIRILRARVSMKKVTSPILQTYLKSRAPQRPRESCVGRQTACRWLPSSVRSSLLSKWFLPPASAAVSLNYIRTQILSRTNLAVSHNRFVVVTDGDARMELVSSLRCRCCLIVLC